MSEHAPFPPSAAHQWMRCAGQHAATVGLPDTDTEYSREGTFAHDIAATCLKNDVDARSLLGETDGEFTLDETMADHIQSYLDAVRECVLFTEGELHIERRVYVTGQVYGTADAAIVASEELHVFDLKYGAGTYVDVRGNEQLRCYGLGVYLSPVICKHQDKIKRIHLHIVQPRYSGAEPHRIETITVEELRAFHEEVCVAVEAALADSPPLTAGEHCKFCKAAATCTALQTRALDHARDVFADTTTLVTPPPAATLTVEQISTILRGVEVFDAWVATVRERAHKMALAGTPIPGFKLVERIGNRRWIDEVAAAKVLQAHGVDPFERTLISPSAVEKKGKALKPIVAQLVMRPNNGTALVAETRKGAAIESPFTSLD